MRTIDARHTSAEGIYKACIILYKTVLLCKCVCCSEGIIYKAYIILYNTVLLCKCVCAVQKGSLRKWLGIIATDSLDSSQCPSITSESLCVNILQPSNRFTIDVQSTNAYGRPKRMGCVCDLMAVSKMSSCSQSFSPSLPWPRNLTPILNIQPVSLSVHWLWEHIH